LKDKDKNLGLNVKNRLLFRNDKELNLCNTLDNLKLISDLKLIDDNESSSYKIDHPCNLINQPCNNNVQPCNNNVKPCNEIVTQTKQFDLEGFVT